MIQKINDRIVKLERQFENTVLNNPDRVEIKFNEDRSDYISVESKLQSFYGHQILNEIKFLKELREYHKNDDILARHGFLKVVKSLNEAETKFFEEKIIEELTKERVKK